LSLDVILDVAIGIADRDGIGAVSMRRLAGELSVTPMALYWHVANRSALLDAMAARVLGTAVFPDGTGLDWDDQLRQSLEAVVAVLRSHRWMGEIATSRYIRTDPYLHLLDQLIGASARAGIDTGTAVELLDISLDWLVTVVAGEATACDPDPALITFFSAQRDYPHVRTAASPLSSVSAGRAQLAISMIIDGFRARAPVGE